MKKTTNITAICLAVATLVFAPNGFAASNDYEPNVNTYEVFENVIAGNDVLDEESNISDSVFQPDNSFRASDEEQVKIQEKEAQAKKFYQERQTLKKVSDQSKQMAIENSAGFYSSTSCILNMVQYPQEKNYYCGNGTARSILMYKGYNCSQTTLAGNSYLKTEQYGNTPWYLSNGDSDSQFPMVNTLRGITGFYYVPAPYGNAGANPISATELSEKVVYTTSQYYGVAICGTSMASSSHASHLPNYPTNTNIGHWIASNGYKNSGSTICIVDPVANSPAVSWGSNVSPKYDISNTKAAVFAATKGIIW